MVLRPLEPAARTTSDFLPAWEVIMRLQKQHYRECWMITQPSHAALAGQIASRLTAPQFRMLEPELVRAIALHDSGWGMPDAQAVMRSRSVAGDRPKSFLEMKVPEFLSAWRQSIEIAQAGSATGGFMVSRHFWRLARHWLKSSGSDKGDRILMESFAEQETARQTRLSQKQARNTVQLEALADILQFCDLLSLYFCSGTRENAEFPEYCGVKMKVITSDDDYHLEPELIASGTQFKVAALRHPATKESSGREIEIRIE